MKAVINTMLITLAAVAFVLLFAALAALVGERAATLAHGGRDNLLLVALAFGCAALSIGNNFGRGTRRAVNATRERVEADHRGTRALIIHLGN